MGYDTKKLLSLISRLSQSWNEKTLIEMYGLSPEDARLILMIRKTEQSRDRERPLD